MRYRRIARLVLLAPLLFALPAEAQTRRIFVGAAVIADNDQTNSALTERIVRSWTFVAGMDVTSHIGVRFIFDTPREVSSFSEGIYRRPPSMLPVHERRTYTQRSMTYGVLADVHGQVAPYVRLAATYGLVTVTHDSEFVVVRNELRPDGSRVPLSDLRDEGDHDWTGFAFGVEAGVLLAGRVEIVPEVRVIYFGISDSPSPYIVRSGLGMRWRF